ncbi:MAG: flagellar motor switch phosphatase FliY [Desulfitobacterium sp.]|nr:flagellar motor switch phosphatase FliY [Desulfitobacterium sp.]
MGNGMLSQEEIDALLGGNLEADPPATEEPVEEFTEIEKDAIGEIANISMGTAATTLSQILGKKVEITTPKVDLASSEQIRKDYPVPSVIVEIQYKSGIQGSNLLILSQRDGAVIVDLMMGGTGLNPPDTLDELAISGVGEAMNQMMGSAATSMSTMFNSVVDITPPNLVLNEMTEGEEDVISSFLNGDGRLVRVSFRMVVEDVIDSILVQVIPVDVAKGMVSKLMGGMDGSEEPEAQQPQPQGAHQEPQVQSPQAQAQPQPQPQVQPQPQFQAQPQPQPQHQYEPQPQQQYYQQPQYQQPQYQQPQLQQSQYQQSQPGGSQNYGQFGAPSTPVQPAQFAPLHPVDPIRGQDNLDLILDVPLHVSVELGKAKKTIKEILELGPGSVIELDRLAGEPVDMIVNGKLVAKCEVVVINETFGIRITDIIQPSERMNKAMGL